jgi:thiol-disulfide isomerase/thioredoxin
MNEELGNPEKRGIWELIIGLWCFLKTAKWHLLALPAYFVVGVWMFDLLVLLACTLGGYAWGFSGWDFLAQVYPKGGFEPNPGLVFWLSCVCFGMGTVELVLLNLIPKRLVLIRRVISIVGPGMAAATALQLLNIMHIRNLPVNLFLEFATVFYAIVFIWMIVKEFARREESLAPAVQRVFPATVTVLVAVFAIMFANQESALWTVGKTLKIRFDKGPIKAEFYYYSSSKDYVKDKDKSQRLAERHKIRLKALLGKYPNDSAADEARMRLYYLATDENDTTEAKQWLDSINENGNASVWTASRFQASTLLEESSPPDFAGALKELGRIDPKTIEGKNEAVVYHKRRASLFRRLGQNKEADQAVQAALEAVDVVGKSSRGKRDLDRMRIKILLEAGRDKETIELVASLLESRGVEDPRKTAGKIVEGLAFATAPVGRPAPELKGKDLMGKEVGLDNFKGKFVLVDFWATWCLPCRQELPHLIEAYRSLNPEGLEVLGISFDSEKAPVAKFIREKNIAWPNLFGTQEWVGSVAERWGVEDIPCNYLVGPDGRVVSNDLRGRGVVNKLRVAMTKTKQKRSP